MAQNQDHGARSQVLQQRQVLELSPVKASGLVPRNMKSAAPVAVAVHVAPNVASIRASGKCRVVATPSVGFGRAVGGPQIETSAAHITKPSTGRGVTSGPASPGLFRGRAG